MNEQTQDLTELLQVGTQAVIATQPNSPQSPRYLVPLKGWEVGAYLMFEAPIIKKEEAGISGRHRRVSVRKKSEVVVRFIRDGKVCAFREVVTDSLSLRDLPHFTVKWPVVFETAYVRKHERVYIGGTCSIELEDGSKLDGELRDISEGGCAFTLAEAIPKDTELTVSIKLQDGNVINNLRSIVRNARSSESEIIHGVEFVELEDVSTQDILIAVKSASAYQRNSESEDSLAVLALTGKDKPSDLFRGMRFKGVDFMVVHDVVECFYLLRSLRCIALIIDCNHDNWSGLDVARLVKASPKTEELKLVMLGVEESQVDLTLTKIGADLCLAKGTAPHELAQNLAQLLAEQLPSLG